MTSAHSTARPDPPPTRQRFPWRRSATLLVVVGGFLAAASFAGSARAPKPLRAVPPGAELPSYVLEELQDDGTVLERGLVEFQGRPVLVVLWATWCGVCAKEMPKLDRLAAAFAGRMPVVALSIDDGGIEVPARYLAGRGLHHLRPYLDSQKANFQALGITGIPAAFVADAAGRIVAYGGGPVPWDAAETRAFLESMLEPAPAAH